MRIAESRIREVINKVTEHDINGTVSEEGLIGVNYLYKGETALNIALKFHFTNIAIDLIDKGIDINTKDRNGRTPFMGACYHGQTKIVSKLLPYIQNINETDLFGQTPLINACISKYDNLEIVDILIENKADVNIQDKNGCTALMYASIAHKESFFRLIQANADINITDKNGNNALMIAIDLGYGKNEDIVYLLAKKTRNMNLQNSNNETALRIAKKHEYQNISKILKDD